MPTYITTADAYKQGLTGCDVYRYSHLLYRDDLSREFGVVSLNVEAFRAFSDTVTLTRRHELAAEQAAVREWLDKRGFEADLPYPVDNASRIRSEYRNYEHLKIACGFELHLKARLLARDFILHVIDGTCDGCKEIAKEQAQRPIAKQELLAVQPYCFSEGQNFLPSLKEASIKFSWITDKPSYRSALGLSDDVLDIIKDYRALRNQIHFPGDIVNVTNIRAYPRPIVEFLKEFINKEIVGVSNSLIARYNMRFKPLSIYV